MQNYSLFPRAIRLVLYAGTAIASLASVPTIISHARQAIVPAVDEDASIKDSSIPAALPHPTPALISIQPVGPDAAARRKAELVALERKLAATRPEK